MDSSVLSSESIFENKQLALQQLAIPMPRLITIHDKLKNYKLVPEISDIIDGAFVRWINIDTKKLHNGGVVCNVLFHDNMYLHCKNFNNRFFSVKFDDNIFFQKLTADEIYLLCVLDNLNKKNCS